MEIDIALKAFADLGDKLDEHTKALYDYTGERLKRPQFIPYTNVTQLNSSGYGIIDIGGPPALYIWIVRLITFSDALAWSNTMGSVTVQFGVGNIPPEAASGQSPMSPNTVRWPFIVAPNAATFGTNYFRLAHGDRLYAQFVGGTANEQVQATAVVEQWLVSALPKGAF